MISSKSKARPGHEKNHHRREHRRVSWCCSFTVPPQSPETLVYSKTPPKPESLSKLNSTSFPNSPQSSRLGLVSRIDPRRILSPGRVSPIDSINSLAESIQETCQVENVVGSVGEIEDLEVKKKEKRESLSEVKEESFDGVGIFDVRLCLRGKNGGSLVLELSSEVLSANSSVFADLIANWRKGSSQICRIEVPDVENLGIFRETIELMFEDDITKRLLNIGVYRTIYILEVAAGIMFSKGILSCLKYLEAVPWSEIEEEKLRNLFTRYKFDDATTIDILARLYLDDTAGSQQNLASQLVWSITTSGEASARNELKSFVKGLLCESSVYEKNQPDLSKEDIYAVCQSCLSSLISLFEEASDGIPHEKLSKKDAAKPLIERISRQVDNINWLLEILLDHQIAEELVNMWADQGDLIKMHENASPMVRYELSRVSAALFIAIGTRNLHCRSDARLRLLQAWFGPMLLDFSWLQRCRKGLDMKTLEEAMGQALLTLPLKHQYVLFMEWFRCFSKQGAECPNLSKAFQIWWRRSFLRGSETQAVESR
ncbi:hypothetical protein RJ641_011127 [Dillenia turbinata]|uniref:At3g05675-like ankyrin-like domain-containing protein n=1 Tax=Dillenia turbinata TaxID=194707 RepID=A0AAN8UT92_9MAGN